MQTITTMTMMNILKMMKLWNDEDEPGKLDHNADIDDNDKNEKIWEMRKPSK